MRREWAVVCDDVPSRVPSYGIPGGSVAGYEDPDGNVFYVYDQKDKV